MSKQEKLERYAAGREQLLQGMIDRLSQDERFVAAWLFGSYGRGEVDLVSDLDLTLVVANPVSDLLCARPWMTAGKTTPERLELFSQFGEIALIYEAHQNALGGGTLSSVFYAGSGVMVDWMLIPQAQAKIPARSRFLFQKIELPADLPPAYYYEGERGKVVEEQIAFFWMMMAITAKYIIRKDTVAVLKFLDLLYRVHNDLERMAANQPWTYQRGSLAPLVLSSKEQIQIIRSLGAKMENLVPQLMVSEDWVAPHPMGEIEALLMLVED